MLRHHILFPANMGLFSVGGVAARSEEAGRGGLELKAGVLSLCSLGSLWAAKAEMPACDPAN